jgi:hypothetical protein
MLLLWVTDYNSCDKAWAKADELQFTCAAQAFFALTGKGIVLIDASYRNTCGYLSLSRGHVEIWAEI